VHVPCSRVCMQRAKCDIASKDLMIRRKEEHGVRR
jgi:hypothetical protein